MGIVHYNGLHWSNPVVDTAAGNQYNAGQGFSSAFVLASCNIDFNGYSTRENSWKSVCSWIQNNGRRKGEIVLRLYWPGTGNFAGAMNGDPGSTLGQQFYSQIVKPAVQNYGIRNFQVLNELNLEYSKSPSQLAGDMYNIAYFIKHQAALDKIGLVYLGFPGPGGGVTDPNSTDWNNYWNNYSGTITKGTDQGSAYNWFGVHAYGFTVDELLNKMNGQYDSLSGKFPGYPMRWTEYSINQNPVSVDYSGRAGACKLAIQGFKNHVEKRSGADVWSVFYYIAYNSEASYNLVSDNSHLDPAATLASTF